MTVDALPPDLEALRGRMSAFLHDELLPLEQEHSISDEGDASPDVRRRVRTRADALGFFRLTQPVEEGGSGLGVLGQVALREAIAASGSVLGRFVLGGSGGMLRQGSADQRERFLKPVLRGELAAAFAFTDARQGPRTTAVRSGDHFLVNGVKSFVTGGPHADLLLTVANVTENDGGPTGVAVFIIRRDAPGVSLQREMRTLDGGVHGVFGLRDVAVDPADILGEIGKGLPRALDNITATRFTVAAQACGTGQWTVQYTLDQIDQPHRTGTPLAEREQVQAMLADSVSDLFAARCALYAAARLAESGANAEVEAAIAKTLATESVTRIVDRAMQLTGGGSVVEDHPLARLYRLVRGWRIAEGTTEILRLTIARGTLARYREGKSGKDEG